MKESSFQGIWPVITIPFLENGLVDEISLRRELDFELEQGVDGLVIFGLASEVYKLSDQERTRIMEITVSHVDGHLPIMAGTEHTGSEAAAQRSHHAQEMGVSGVMAYPPSFVKPDAAGVLEYYQMISERIHIPMMIQDAQAWTQVPLPVDLLVKLNREVEAAKYVKIETVPTGPKISKVIEASEGKLGVFGGYGGLYYVDEMGRGAVGTLIPPAISDCFISIHRTFHEGSIKECELLYQTVLPFLLFEMSSLDTLIEIQKHMFHRAGIFQTTVSRKPHSPMDRQQYQQLDRFLGQHDFSIMRKKV